MTEICSGVLRGAVIRESGCSLRRTLLMSIGSSITAHGKYDTAGFFGTDAVGTIEWAVRQTGQRCNFVNRATSGETTTQMIARFNADVLTHKPYAILIQNGTNEIGDGYDSVTATCKTLYDMARLSGAKVGILATQPRNTTNGGLWTTSQLKKASAVNEYKRRYCESHNNLTFIDCTKFVTDPNNADGEAILDFFRDGTHYSPRGAFAGAQPIIPWLESVFPERDVSLSYRLSPDTTDFIYGNELFNTTFSGTGGTTGSGTTGTLPDNYQGLYVGGTTTGAMVASVAARSTLDPRREVALVLTPSGAAGIEYFYLSTAGSNLTPDNANEMYEALVNIEVDAWDGWEYIALELRNQSSGKTYIDCGNANDLPMPKHAWSGVMRTPYHDVGTEVQRWRMRIGIKGDAIGTGTLRLHSPVLRGLDPDSSLLLLQNVENG